jgi:hypothetical protein
LSRSTTRARDGRSLAVVSRHLGGGGGTSALGTYVGPRSVTGVTACACAARAGTGRGGGAARGFGDGRGAEKFGAVGKTSARKDAFSVFSVVLALPDESSSVTVAGTVTVALATDAACDACAVGIEGKDTSRASSPEPFGSSSIVGSGEGPIDVHIRDSSGDVSARVSGSFARRDARSAGPSSETRIRTS